MEDDRAEQHTIRVDHIHRVVERPKSQTQAVHVNTYHRRIPHKHRLIGLYLLFLRSANGGRWAGGVRAACHDRWMDDHVYGRVQLRRRCDYGKFRVQTASVKGPMYTISQGCRSI